MGIPGIHASFMMTKSLLITLLQCIRPKGSGETTSTVPEKAQHSKLIHDFKKEINPATSNKKKFPQLDKGDVSKTQNSYHT